MANMRTMIVKFNQTISSREIPLFRGAVIQALDKKDDTLLFHNHENDGFRYAYPLIQYKRINGNAAIVCLNEGTESIGAFFSSGNFNFLIGDREVHLEIESVKTNQFNTQIWETQFAYRIRKWLPLNSDNYKEYRSLDGVVEKSAFLEKILIGNILSFAKGIGLYFEKKVECKLTALSEPLPASNKGIKLMAFDIEFKSNVSLPDFIGLGKHSSIGYGIVTNKHT